MDGLPDALVEKYRQYKDSTNEIITWLATTSYHGLNINSVQIPDPEQAQPGKGGRNRGKKGAAARRAAQRATHAKAAAPVITVAVGDLVTTANEIVEKGSKSLQVFCTDSKKSSRRAWHAPVGTSNNQTAIPRIRHTVTLSAYYSKYSTHSLDAEPPLRLALTSTYHRRPRTTQMRTLRTYSTFLKI